ncbi:MAG: matrixin family metalloprotease [Acidobacteriota bacterium]
MSGAISSEQVRRAQEYLRRYGYLSGVGCSLFQAFGIDRRAAAGSAGTRRLLRDHAGQMGQCTEAALRRLQEFSGLYPTGRLDEDTLHLMSLPRCGVPDALRYVVTGLRWDHTDLTYCFGEMTMQLFPQLVRDAVQEALNTWARVSTVRFQETELPDHADIVFRFARGTHGPCPVSFDGHGGDLAHAFPPPPRDGALAGDVHFDDAEHWVSDSTATGSGTVDLVTIAIHEIGHSLGLDHTSVPGRVMYHSYQGAKRDLDADDIAGIRHLYGV